MSESALRLQRGELLDGEQVDREVMNVLSSVRSHMRALPSRISSLLLGLTRPQIHAVIKNMLIWHCARRASSICVSSWAKTCISGHFAGGLKKWPFSALFYL